MGRTGGPARTGWGTALALTAAVLLLAVLPPGPLILLPLLVLWAGRVRSELGRAAGLLALVLLAFALPGDALTELGRGWALLLGAGFLGASLLRPRWPVLSRALCAVAAAAALSGLWLAATDGWAVLDALMRTHFRTAAAQIFGGLGFQFPDSEWVSGLYEAGQRAADLRWQVYPAMLGLQSLAALGLAAWALPRLRRRGGQSLRLRPLREFRFSDQLVWVLIAGLLLVLAAPGAALERTGANALVFMGALYALRGLGVMLFLAGGGISLWGMVFGTLAVIFLYPLVLATVLVVGLGDTWLDVRGRAAVAPRG